MYYIELIAGRFFFQTDDFYFYLKKIKNVDLSAFFFISNQFSELEKEGHYLFANTGIHLWKT